MKMETAMTAKKKEAPEPKKAWASKTMWLGTLTTVGTVISFWNEPLGDFLKENSQLIMTTIGGAILILRGVTSSGIKL